MVQQLAPALKVLPDGIAEVSLAPDELGRVRLAMRTEGDAILVHIAAERPETQDLLQRHTAQLSAALRDAGYADVQYAFSQNGRQRPQADLPGHAPGQESSETTETRPFQPAPQPSDRLDLRL